MTVKEAVAVIDNAEQITLAESGCAFRLDVTSEVQMRAYGAFRVRKITAWDGEQNEKIRNAELFPNHRGTARRNTAAPAR